MLYSLTSILVFLYFTPDFGTGNSVFHKFEKFENSQLDPSLSYKSVEWNADFDYVPSLYVCLTVCDKEEGCRAVDYDTSNKKCNLKRAFYGIVSSGPQKQVYAKVHKVTEFKLYENSEEAPDFPLESLIFNSTFLNGTTLEYCQQMCNIDTLCKAISFYSSTNICYFKSNFMGKVESPGCSLYVKKEISYQYRLFEDSIPIPSLPFTSIKWASSSRKVENVESCLLQCNEDIICKAIEFNVESMVCNLKSGFFGKNFSSGHNTYVKLEKDLKYNLYDNSIVKDDIPFTPSVWQLSNQKVPDISICLDICNRYGECKFEKFNFRIVY
ncbi:DgyrCDS14509 [Dimorphilus gyrociliatus]|uniref:DgyrCDS14509 n=1 Tax=Dimorphilus gyrociliatus TaxID=2664684 RepID=A0A7I8WDU3_9ANNE|nr:DgyrCDS14509 [Dimorphilus gyrociliatus]